MSQRIVVLGGGTGGTLGANRPTPAASTAPRGTSSVMTAERGPIRPGGDGHANCFIETGFGKALLIARIAGIPKPRGCI